jgi:hypothetical protein
MPSSDVRSGRCEPGRFRTRRATSGTDGRQEERKMAGLMTKTGKLGYVVE